MKTVEATVLVPILLVIMVMAGNAAISFYNEIKGENEVAIVEELWAVKSFYEEKAISEVL